MPIKSWSELMNEAAEVTNTFELLEDGSYSFVIKDLPKVGQTKTEKTRYSINPVVESGPRANARLFHDFIISPESPKAMAFFFRDMETLGLDKNFWATNPSDDGIARALVGRRFTADVYSEEYNGKKNNRLRNIRGPVGAAPAGPAGPSVPTVAAGAPAGVPAVAAAPVYAQPVAAAPAPAPVYAQPVAAPVAVAPAPVAVAPAPAPAPVAAAPAAVVAPPVESPWGSAPVAPPTF